MPDTSEILPIGQAAKQLARTTESALRGKIARREVETIRIGNRYFITLNELRRVFGDEFKKRFAA